MDSKSFKLLSYFSQASLASIVLATFLLSVLYREVSRDYLVSVAEAGSVSLTQVFANSAWDDFDGFIIDSENLSDEELRKSAKTDALERLVMRLGRDTSMVKLKLFDMNGRTIFSNDRMQIGEKHGDSKGYLAARAGKVESDLTHREKFKSFKGEISDRDLLASYVPMRRGPDSEIDGVLEIYSDVTPLVLDINRQQIAVTVGVIGVLCVLYALLFFIVKWADGLIVRASRDLLQAKMKADDALGELSAYIQAIDSHALVVVVDSAGLLQHVNDKFRRVLGYAKGSAFGEILREANDAQLLNLHSAILPKLNEGGVWRGELACHKPDGGIFWGDAALVPLGTQGRFVAVMLDITAYKETQEKITHVAMHDNLTGLPNRLLLGERVDQALAWAKDGGRAALLFIDLDGFKPVNDTYGHDIGDLLLESVAGRLKSGVRSGDIVARIGGDEFVVLLPQIRDADDAGRVAEKLLKLLREPFEVGGHGVQIGASIGIGLYPDDASDAESLFKCSDSAMYRAKEGGRNRYCYFCEQTSGG